MKRENLKRAKEIEESIKAIDSTVEGIQLAQKGDVTYNLQINGTNVLLSRINAVPNSEKNYFSKIEDEELCRFFVFYKEKLLKKRQELLNEMESL